MRPTDRAEAPLLARLCGNPTDLAAAVSLRHTDAETILEALPLLGQQRRRARCHEAQRRCFDRRQGVAIQQDADGGRIAGGDRRAMTLDVFEEPAAREFPPEDERG